MNDMRDVFDAREYLGRYFTAPSDEDRFSLKFWVDHIHDLPQGVRVLEYGGGPTLYSVLALARKASSVHFSDFVPSALNDVRAWTAGKTGAHNWRPYTRLILQIEGQPHDETAVDARENRLRQIMTHITECDARTTTMLTDPRPPYDVIAAHHCLDVAARDPADFKRMLRSLAGWLTPGGLFLLSITTGTTWYTVDGATFPCLDLTVDQVHASLVEAGMQPGRLAHASMPIEGDEYTGVVLSAGWKPHTDRNPGPA